jgi:aminoglycoside 6'-N-acetyltransferase
MNQFEFKTLEEADLGLLYRWFQDPTIKQHYARGRAFTSKDIKNKYLPRILGEENIPSFIAYKNNNPIGFIQYYVLSEHLPEGILNYKNSLFSQYSPDEVVGIDCFIASGSNRGQGIGAQLINDFIAEFLMQFRSVIVDPAYDNTFAIRCYEKADFKKTAYSEDKNYLVMLKTIERQFENPISTKNAPHFTWGNSCDGWWLKKEGNFTVISETMPPDTAEKKHYHTKTEQFFYCLQGQLLLQLENGEYLLSPNEGCEVPKGIAHKVRNITSKNTHFLVISSPNSHDDRIDLE